MSEPTYTDTTTEADGHITIERVEGDRRLRVNTEVGEDRDAAVAKLNEALAQAWPYTYAPLDVPARRAPRRP